MVEYILRRLLLIPVILIGIAFICFLIMYVVPLDPARAVAGHRATADAVARVERELGLDQPLHVQFARYMGRILRGDFGRSFHYNLPVSEAIIKRIPATLKLAVAGIIVQLFIGLPVGFISAVKRYSWFDRVSTVGSLLALSAPPFWMGLMLLFFLGYKVRIFPLGGYGGLRYLVLPALTVGMHFAPWYARMFRSSLIDVLSADYVRTARSKGMREVAVYIRHIFPNSVGPVITMIGMDLGLFLSGVLVVEIVFGWPGLGRLAWDGLIYLDLPLIVGTVLFSSFLIVMMNLVVDVLYGVLDPRIRYE